MIEVFRAVDATNDNRLIVYRDADRFGAPVHTIVISDADNTQRLAVKLTGVEADVVAEHLLLGGMERRRR